MQKIDINAILTDISPNVIGEDLTYSQVYDEIRQARYEEDDRLSQGVWERDFAKADWQKVQNLTINALCHQSKDLQLIAWLIDSLVATNGLDGLISGLRILNNFWPKYGAICYPLEDEKSDNEQKHRIFDWLDEAVHKRIQLITIFDKFSLYAYDFGLKNPDQNEISLDDLNINDTDLNNFFSKLEEAKTLIKNLSIDGLFSKVLEDFNRFQKLFTKKADDLALANQPEEKLSKRDEIYKALELITGQLEKIEKHSPSPYLLRLVISWKDKTLLEIMTDLQTGTSQPHQLLKMLVG